MLHDAADAADADECRRQPRYCAVMRAMSADAARCHFRALRLLRRWRCAFHGHAMRQPCYAAMR